MYTVPSPEYSNRTTSEQYLRASDIVRNRKKGRDGILPISNATLWAWAKEGRLQPIKLSAGVTVFRKSDVIALAESIGHAAA